MVRYINSNDRIVEGYGSVEIYDNANELIPISFIKERMDDYVARGGSIMYKHTNQNVGKLEKWEITEKEGKPAIYLKTKLFNSSQEDDAVWRDVQQGIIKAFSIGGGKPKRQVTKEGNIIYDFPIWEFSLVPRGANPSATIEAISVAKEDMPILEIPIKKSEFKFSKDELLLAFTQEITNFDSDVDPYDIINIIVTRLSEDVNYYKNNSLNIEKSNGGNIMSEETKKPEEKPTTPNEEKVDNKKDDVAKILESFKTEMIGRFDSIDAKVAKIQKEYEDSKKDREEDKKKEEMEKEKDVEKKDVKKSVPADLPTQNVKKSGSIVDEMKAKGIL